MVIIDSLKIDSSATTQKPILQKEVKLISAYNFDFNKIHKTDSLGLVKPPSPCKQTGYTGNEYLKPFFEKLQELEQDSTASARIAYYGDSMVDGDLIVQDLRSALQTRFGGQGVGFVSIKSKSARSRYSVKHFSRGNWEKQSFMRAASDSISYGINGFIFKAQDSTAGVAFKASGIKNSYRLNSPQLFYGRGTDSSFVNIKRGKDSLAIKLLKCIVHLKRFELIAILAR